MIYFFVFYYLNNTYLHKYAKCNFLTGFVCNRAEGAKIQHFFDKPSIKLAVSRVFNMFLILF